MKLFFGILFALLLATSAAVAQYNCIPREEIIKQLKTKYNEEPVSISVTNGGLLIEIFESADKKTWTIVTTSPNTKISCVISAGKYWITKKEGERI